MNICRMRLRAGRPQDLAGTPFDIAIAASSEPGTSVRVPAGRPSLWISLDAGLRIELPEGRFLLGRRHCYAGSGETAVTGLTRQTGRWLVLLLPEPAARGLLPSSYPLLAQPLQRGLLRAVATLWRLSAQAPAADWSLAQALRALRAALAETQRSVDALLPRCPGKTVAQRRQVLQRLLRVRNRIELGDGDAASVAGMAALAHYSPCHFIRVFEQVFGETPYQFLLALRMRRAAELLGRQHYAIVEIAERLGFSSGASFSRAFRAHFRETPSDLRRRLHGGAGARLCG